MIRPRGDVPSDAILFSVRRSARARRARLTVTADGDAVVVLPVRAAARSAGVLVDRHADWLVRQVRLARERQARLAARPALAEGRTLVVGGVAHRIVAIETPARRRSFVIVSDATGRSMLELRVHVAPTDGRTVKALVEAWLRRQAAIQLDTRVAVFAPALGVRPSRVSVRAARRRWGSASVAGAISFSWRLVLAPTSVLDYVVVHELAHLVQPGHGRDFWALVRTHAPHVDEARGWLRRHHLELLAALD